MSLVASLLRPLARGSRLRPPLRRYAAAYRRRNEDIACESIILIDEKGLNHGTKNGKDVLGRLNRKLYDLVEVSRAGAMPICKIMPVAPPPKDRSESATLPRQSPTGSSKSATAPPKSKEMSFSSAIAAHDYARKVSQTREFLARGYLVQLSISGKDRAGEGDTKRSFHERLMKDLRGHGQLKGPVRQSAHEWHWLMLGFKRDGAAQDELGSAHDSDPDKSQAEQKSQ